MSCQGQVLRGSPGHPRKVVGVLAREGFDARPGARQRTEPSDQLRDLVRRRARIVPNHLVDCPVYEVIPDPEALAQLGERSLVVWKTRPLPIEAVVRGYLVGSG